MFKQWTVIAVMVVLALMANDAEAGPCQVLQWPVPLAKCKDAKGNIVQNPLNKRCRGDNCRKTPKQKNQNMIKKQR